MITYLQDDISSDHIRSRQMFVCMHDAECKQLRTYTWNGSLSVLQHCNFSLLTFYILEF
jgi:hypothetical protein